MDESDLYGLPLERFVPERGALAKAIRADGDRDRAAAVAALRKPSVAAWAVNQLVRTQGDAVGDLFAAGDALRELQAAILEGRAKPSELREAVAHERDAVDDLIERARGLLSSDGHELSATIVERVSDTLHAAALDDDARELVAGGRLERELQHVGFGLGGMPAPPSPTPSPPTEHTPSQPKPAKAKPADRAREEREREQREQREQREREEREEREHEERERKATARKAERTARKRLDRAAKALDTAEDRHERAAQALADAQSELEAARTEHDQAAAEHHEAEQALG